MHRTSTIGVTGVMFNHTAFCLPFIAALLMVLAVWAGASGQVAESPPEAGDGGTVAPGEPASPSAAGANLTWQKFPAEFADYYTTQRIPSTAAEPQPFCKSAKPIRVGPHSTLFTMNAILDESGGTGTGYDTLYVDANNTGDFSNAQVYKVSPQDRKTGLEGHPLISYFENVNIQRGWDSVHSPGSAHVQLFIEQNPDRIDGADYLVNMIPAQWAVGTIQIDGQPTPIAMVDGTFNDSAVDRIGMRPQLLNRMSPGDDAGLVRSDFLIIGKPGDTSLQPGDPNSWLGKTGSARSMNTQYLVTDAGTFEIKADQVEGGVNLQLAPANVPTSTVDLSQIPHDGRLSMFGTNACVLLDNPGESVQVPADSYYVPLLGPTIVSAPAGEAVTLTPPEGFNAAGAREADASADRDQKIFAKADPTLEEMQAAGQQLSGGNSSSSGAPRAGWQKMEISFVAADSGQPVAKASVVADCYSGGSSGSRRMTTDQTGKCALSLPSGELQYVRIMVDAPGYVPAWRFWNARGAALPEQYTWSMERGTTIGGVVRDEHGRPIGGVQVSISTGADQFSFFSEKPEPYLGGLIITTDSRGKWQCKSAPAKLSQVRIGLSHPNYISDKGPTRTVKAETLRDQTCELVMKAGVTLTGKVITVKGKPVEKAVIGWGDYSGSTNSDRQGRFRIASLTPGTVSLTVRAPGYAPAIKKVTIEQDVRPIEIKLELGKTLKGRIVDAAGKGIAKAQVMLSSWQGTSYWWYTMTDAQGRFTWKEAPADEVELRVSADGYAPQYSWRVKAGNDEQVLTLKDLLEVTGRVVDAATGAPIPSFTVVPGSLNGPAVYWLRWAGAAGKDGAFRLKIEGSGSRFQVRAEAPGYKPAASKVFTEAEMGQPLELALEAGQGASGTVLGLDGQPVADAQVMIGTPSQPASLVNGRAQPQLTSAAATGPDGRFTLPAETESYTVVAVHETGMAQVSQKEFEANPQVRLQPWARIEGQIRKGISPASEESVVVVGGSSQDRSSAINAYSQQSTDAEGRFVVERVVPGEVQIYRNPGQGKSVSFSNVTRVTIKPGQTKQVTLGGAGRTVTGRLEVPSAASSKVDWQHCMFLLQARRKAPKLPGDLISKGHEAVQKWYKTWLETDAGQASHLADEPTYGQVEHDGTFQIENVPAGEYLLCACAFDVADEGDQRSFRGLANVVHEVRVPGEPVTNEALDIGRMEMKTVSALEVGKNAPQFEVKSADGKTLRLGDYRGKYVLLTFWAGSLAYNSQALEPLISLQKRYGKDDRLVMIGLNLDARAEDARTYAVLYGMSGSQGLLGEWSKATLPGEYGIALLPSYVLVSPEGKIQANSPEPRGIESALVKALGPGADPSRSADTQPTRAASSQPAGPRATSQPAEGASGS